MCTYPNILLSSTFACCLIFPFLHLVDLLLDIRFYIWNIQHFSKKWMRMPLLKVSIHYSSCCVVFSIYLCVENVPFMWFIWLSQFDDAEQLFSSYFIAATVTAAIAALCCSIVPPLSRIRILFRVAIGQPDALKTINHVSALIIKKFISFLLKFIQWIFNKMNLRCDKNFPVEWPEPSLKWEIGKKRKQSKFKIMWNGNSKLVFLKFESSYIVINLIFQLKEKKSIYHPGIGHLEQEKWKTKMICIISSVLSTFLALKDIYLNGSDSWPSRGLLFGLLARGHPDKLRCDE